MIRTWLASLGVLLLAAGCAAPAGSESAPKPRDQASSSSPSPSYAAPPAWTAGLPAATSQVIRTVSSTQWCAEVYCTVTEAWERRGAAWEKVRAFPSTIGPKGWGKQRQDDGGTPEGVFTIKVTFSTSATNPGRMPWRRRLPTSNVTDEPGPHYNTWLEEPDRTNGDRPAMRWGFVVDFNNVRLQPGVGPAPVPGAGSGIFYHTTKPGYEFVPSEGCTSLAHPEDMRWLLEWLDPAAAPRIVQNR